MSDNAFNIGDRVRVIRGESFFSRIHEGKKGVVVPRHHPLSETEPAEHLAAFPVSVRFDGQEHAFVWAVDDLERTS